MSGSLCARGQSWAWTVRGLDNKVLREFTSSEPNQSPGLPTPGGQWKKDYVWRDSLLLTSTDISGTYHYHLDHLGTPRLITNMSHTKVAEHAYYPFGAEISFFPHESIEEAMKFTGNERDLVAGDGRTLDDMPARYYNTAQCCIGNDTGCIKGHRQPVVGRISPALT
jgi:hypothetical protein